MTSKNDAGIPAEMVRPKLWPYNIKWDREIDEKIGWANVEEACGVIRSGSEIRDFLIYEGQKAFEKVVIQNQILNNIRSGKVDFKNFGRTDVDWQMGNTWQKLLDSADKVFLAYGVENAPKEIVDSFNFTKNFIQTGHRHAEAIIQYAAMEGNRLKDMENNEYISRQRERDRIRSEQLEEIKNNRAKWVNIEVEHSAVENGFVYVLENILMPGVYKIGFTSGNPDKRAAQISQQYGLPSPFVVVEYWRTKDPFIVEQRIHSKLSGVRRGGEFFQIDFDELKSVIVENIL